MKVLFSLLTILITLSSVHADTVKYESGKIVITCEGSGCDNKPVFYVDFPASVVFPPNNNAYSGASITKEGNLIYLSGVTGQDLNGNPIPPTGQYPFFDYQDQITQSYQNLINILQYLKIPVTNVLKLDVLLEGGHVGEVFDVRRAQTNVAENIFWGANKPKPPRTITGVLALNLGVCEVSAIVWNPYPVIVKKK